VDPAVAATEPRYTALYADGVVRLSDHSAQTAVAISPSAGNVAFEMRVNGRNALWFPFDSIDEFKASGHGRAGIPFLGPWANRLDEQAFYANGRRFAFDMDIGNVRGDVPIHGLLMETDRWQVVEVGADASSAWVTSRLDFYREPLWMKQFPFAHAVYHTHRVRGGILEVVTRIESLTADPMPVAIGFHPYFQLPDSDRTDWMVSIGARRRWLLAPIKAPYGETESIDRLLPRPDAVAVKDHKLDDVFDDLVRDANGHAVMSVWSAAQRIDVEVGPNYRCMVVYAPEPEALRQGGMARPGSFVCLEPMAGISNSMNLAHRGLYQDLQYIAPGGVWEESFRVKATF
jgi:aldose 1-epimerase